MQIKREIFSGLANLILVIGALFGIIGTVIIYFDKVRESVSYSIDYSKVVDGTTARLGVGRSKNARLPTGRT
jgi:hypothetical protein